MEMINTISMKNVVYQIYLTHNLWLMTNDFLLV